MKRILVVGAKGMLGRAMVKHLRAQKLDAVEWDLGDGDLSSATLAAWAVRNTKSDAVINCAGYTDVEGCEDPANEAVMTAANVTLAGNLAAACKKRVIPLVHISTDYVFDGRTDRPYHEGDTPAPLSRYAQSKLDGERAVLETDEDALVIRTAWLYGRHGRNFVDTIRRKARETDRLEVVNDQTGCPTYANDLAAAILFVLRGGLAGIVHAAGGGSTTWYGLACKIVEILGLPTQVVPCSTADHPLKAARPAYSVLECERLSDEAGYTLRSWEDALREYLTMG